MLLKFDNVSRETFESGFKLRVLHQTLSDVGVYQ